MAGILLQNVNEDPRQRRPWPGVVVAEPAAGDADIGQLGRGGDGPRLLASGVKFGDEAGGDVAWPGVPAPRLVFVPERIGELLGAESPAQPPPLHVGQLADAYGVTDTDGSKPDCWGYLAAYGWEREDGEGIDRFR